MKSYNAYNIENKVSSLEYQYAGFSGVLVGHPFDTLKVSSHVAVKIYSRNTKTIVIGAYAIWPKI